jgi:hypothetical protein
MRVASSGRGMEIDSRESAGIRRSARPGINMGDLEKPSKNHGFSRS